jgi:glycosyltransferase involved in cell wall biosynthesis
MANNLVDSTSERPSVSVIVPFYNSERHLAACIESLLSQEDVGGPYEILFIDNGSTDGSASIVAEYGELTVLEEPTPGAYAARNTGLRRARAPLIAFTDADCVVASDWLSSLRDGMRDSSIAILLGQCLYPRDASMAMRVLGAYENAKTDYVVNRCAKAHHFAYANNMVIRASVFEEIGPFKQWKRAADTELVHRLASARPDLRLAYRSSMKVTHMEFRHARERARRQFLYTRTNSQIETFRELGLAGRVGLLLHLLRGQKEYDRNGP